MAAVLAALATTGHPGSARAAPPVKGDGGIVFSFHGPDAQAVFVAGDFNNWNAQDMPMTHQDSGDWTAVVPLDPGTYEYKFITDTTFYGESSSRSTAQGTNQRRIDGTIEEYLTECGLEFGFPDKCGVLNGVGVDSALP